MMNLLFPAIGAIGLCAVGRVPHHADEPIVRLDYDHEATITAPAARIWPLLCPVRERDWVPGWQAEILFSRSGHAEDGCVFRTRHEGRQFAWMATRYEPETGGLDYTVFGEAVMFKLEIRLQDLSDGKCRLRWRRILTSLNADGAVYLRQYTRQRFEAETELLMARLDHYCRTGAMLTGHGD